MQVKLTGVKTLSEPPFAVGVFQGHGEWADRQGGQGTYRTELTILADANGVITHIATRVFLNGDGAVHRQEYSLVQFISPAESFFEVGARFEGKEYRGHGYCFGNRCHYEVTRADGARIEATYALNENSIQLLGSYTMDGNLTVRAETLLRARLTYARHPNRNKMNITTSH